MLWKHKDRKNTITRSVLHLVLQILEWSINWINLLEFFGIVQMEKHQLWKTFFLCVRETKLCLENKYCLEQKHNSYICLRQTHCSIKHVFNMLSRNNLFVHSAITEEWAINQFSHSLLFSQIKEKSFNFNYRTFESVACVFFFSFDKRLWTQTYSVNDFLHVEMASHQQWEAVPLFNRHGAEGL